MKEIVEYLINKKETISTMESCTGGALANAITNIEGASEIIKFSAVTYSNEYKIKMGVSANTIEKYTVYSQEVAREMSKVISTYTNSDYGVGITGKLNSIDPANPFGDNSMVYLSIYSKKENKYYEATTSCQKRIREDNKETVINTFIILFNTIISK